MLNSTLSSMNMGVFTEVELVPITAAQKAEMTLILVPLQEGLLASRSERHMVRLGGTYGSHSPA